MIRTLIALLVSIFTASASRAALDQPVRQIDELRNPARTSVTPVLSAKIVLADYALIRKDFPTLESATEAEIDQWLLQKTGWVAVTQAQQTDVNDQVNSQFAGKKFGGGKGTPAAYRPEGYGRSLVFQFPEGLIDAKGAGAVAPMAGDHSNGLASLGEAIREFVYEKAVDRILRHAGATVQTVGTYAVLDYGFNIVFADGTAPAGLVLRQAHTRSTRAESRLSSAQALKIENLIRPYGFTSMGLRYEKQSHKILNIQGTADERAIVDFGTFLVTNHEFNESISLGTGTLQSDSPDFVRTNRALRTPPEIWGCPGRIDPTADRPWIWSHELASNWRQGVAKREDFDRHLRNFMEPIEKNLAVSPRVLSSPELQCASLLGP